MKFEHTFSGYLYQSKELPSADFIEEIHKSWKTDCWKSDSLVVEVCPMDYLFLKDQWEGTWFQPEVRFQNTPGEIRIWVDDQFSWLTVRIQFKKEATLSWSEEHVLELSHQLVQLEAQKKLLQDNLVEIRDKIQSWSENFR